MIVISIDTESKEPIYEQIYKYFRREIINGNLAPKTKLPSARRLASDISVSRSTIDMAYGQLVAEGYIEAFEKRGFFVCDLEELYENEIITVAPGMIQEENASSMEDEDIIDFSISGVDMNYFPYDKWRKLMRESLIDDNKELFVSGNPQGDLHLRKALQDYLHQARGVNCDVDQIIIGAGSDYMLLLLSRIFNEKKRVAMENPTYMQARAVFQNIGYEVEPVNVDDQGMRVADLEEADVNLVYVTPSHQFPLGMVMSAKNKQKLLAWASKEDNRYIIEDDYDSEFRYLGRPIPALQSQDPFGRVIYMGTLSKVIAPGIRIGYMVLPKSMLPMYQKNASFYYATVSRLDQQVLSRFFVEGYFSRHLHRMKKIYKNKHDCLLQEIKKTGLQVEIGGESAGLHICLQIGEPLENADQIEKELVELARENGVKVYPLSVFYCVSMKRKPTILIGFARLTENEIVRGVSLLAKAWKNKF